MAEIDAKLSNKNFDSILNKIINGPAYSGSLPMKFIEYGSVAQLPYISGGMISTQVSILGSNASYTGINKIESSSPPSIHCSDSFSPCVPVIAMNSKKSVLAHFNGTVLLDRFSRELIPFSKVFIIRRNKRTGGPLNKEMAITDAINEKVSKNGFLDVHIVNISTPDRIAIIYSSVTKRGVVFRHQ